MAFRNKSVDVHQFAMVPKADIPRSSFDMQTTHKTTFDAGYLIPVYLDEILPGDSFRLKMTAFARLATPIFPVMDNMVMDSFFFFVPNRLVWTNWAKFMGEQANPGDSISYTIPQQVSPANGYAINSLQDYLGLPTVGQLAANATFSHSALPLRACNLIWNQWFRDQNLQSSLTVDMGDGPDANASVNYALQQRGKRHDYFTSALTAPQKGTAISLPLGTSAPVKLLATNGTHQYLRKTADHTVNPNVALTSAAGTAEIYGGGIESVLDPNGTMYADLSVATAATINQLRQSFQIQKLLERDARGGTRLTEIIRAHFGVVSPDARMQRPEYLGGGSSPVTFKEIEQNGGTNANGTTTPLGTLAASGKLLAHGHGFTQSFTEHGHVLGFVAVRADLTYQQGVRKMWNRSTRYDFYFPAFAALGEQSVLNQEIYVRGDANDTATFGYQERWAEYRYHPARISGLFRSTANGTIDPWHLAQNFSSLPTLNATFIKDTPPVSRIVAVGSAANGKQFIFDSFFDIRAARPMPLYSVPGLIDHF